MPPMHVAARPRFFNMCMKNAEPRHGHFIEYAMGVTNILVQLGFIWGSYLFLSSDDGDLRLGDTFFILGSVITFAFALYALVESRAHWEHYQQAEREDRIEFWESVLFFLAGLVFLLGSLFYWPGIYKWWYADQEETVINNMEENGEGKGAGCFIAGSILFLMASMFNAIGLGMNKEENEQNDNMRVVHYVHLLALLCSQLGSALFIAGSIMYRPILGSVCPDFDPRYEGAAQAGEPVAEHACETSGEMGTYLYIYGSILYLIEALLNFFNTAFKHLKCDSDKVGHKEQQEEEEDDIANLLQG